MCLCRDSEVVVLLVQENELHNDENGEKKLVSGVMRNRGCIKKSSGTYALIKILIFENFIKTAMCVKTLLKIRKFFPPRD